MNNSRRSLRIRSFIFLIIVVFETIYPSVALAVADGPGQAEFEGYEDFDATDMVNLSTGDFCYNVPLLNVPSPEGGFQMPLAYHAGIETDEESSWVGLGWSLNPGVITRNVSTYPDDFNGEVVSTNVYSPNQITGYVKSYPFYTRYYDSQKGKGGTIGTGFWDVGWGTQKHFGLSITGLTLKDGRISYDSEYQKQGLIMAAWTAASLFSGPAAPVVAAGQIAYSIHSAAQARDGLKAALGTSQYGQWTVDKYIAEKGGLGGIWGRKVAYKAYLNSTVNNTEYGLLYLGSMQSAISLATLFGQGDNYVYNQSSVPSSWSSGLVNNTARIFQSTSGIPSSDMYVNYSGSYDANYQPASLTPDLYNVSGFGVSGSISPYRLEIGSLCNQIPYGTSFSANVGPKYLTYKVPFKYLGDFSNSYTFPRLGNDDISNPGYLYDLHTSGTAGSVNLHLLNKTSKTHSDYPASTPVSAYNQNYSASNITEGNRTGLNNYALSHAKHIQWYTNDQMVNSWGGIMQTDINLGRLNSDYPSDGIGGFAITNEQGYTYHYTIPVYNTKEVQKTRMTSTDTRYTVANNNRYATSWLLTGITGPDFVDRGVAAYIDDQDWGYWVKFEYGKVSDKYNWRNPYYHYHESPGVESYTSGKKQTFYLNRIATRTHSALFVKSLKTDGKGYYESDGVGPWGEAVDTEPSSSLRLDDIYVLPNSDYETLISTGSGGYSLGMVNTSTENSYLKNGDTYDNVYDNYDFEVGVTNSPIQAFLSANQLQRIHFNYNYNLCRYTWNSYNFGSSLPTHNAEYVVDSLGLKGKLTLRSVEVKGKENTKMIPSYEFYYGDESNSNYQATYGDNPWYHPLKWDGYGMYKSGSDGTEITPHQSEKKADQWCLSKIVAPTGASLTIEYERDVYSNINGYPVTNSPLNISIANSLSNPVTAHSQVLGTTTQFSDFFTVGANVKVYYYTTASQNMFNVSTMNTTISNVSGSNITLASFPTSPFYGVYQLGVVSNVKYGGGIRVKRITAKDENNEEFVTKYIYTQNGLESGTTSGVASYESPYDKTDVGEFGFYGLTDHPYCPIIYSNVAVVTGRSDNTFKENSKQCFKFSTPHHSLITTSSDYQVISDIGMLGKYSKNSTVDNTSKIGNLEEARLYNQYGNLTSKTVYNYTDNAGNEYLNNLGHYSEMTFLWETIRMSTTNSVFPKIIQSYKLKRPSILKSVFTYKDRLVSKHIIHKYDYMTGLVLRSEDNSGNSKERYETEVVPAYTKYPEMGSKIDNIWNKNMMAAQAAMYTRAMDKTNQWKLIGATIMTWKENHTSRGYNTSTQKYENVTATNDNVWLPYQTYDWKSRVEENGTIPGSLYGNNILTAFNFSSPSSSVYWPYWQKTSETSLYDHFSHNLETRDINTSPTSVKYGYGSAYPIGTCENAAYSTWCYSGAEDISSVSGYFDNEVKGSSTQFASSTYAHTGKYCSKIPVGNDGFVFSIKKSELSTSGYMRASVWVHQNGNQNAYLSCRAFGVINNNLGIIGSCMTGAGYNAGPNLSSEQAGSWYLMNVDINLALIPSTADRIEFAITNMGFKSNFDVYADDFRVHPIASPIVSTVYDKKTGSVLAMLDKDNYATKYFYDKNNKLISVQRETKSGFVVVSNSGYNYAK